MEISGEIRLSLNRNLFMKFPFPSHNQTLSDLCEPKTIKNHFRLFKIHEEIAFFSGAQQQRSCHSQSEQFLRRKKKEEEERGEKDEENEKNRCCVKNNKKKVFLGTDEWQQSRGRSEMVDGS